MKLHILLARLVALATGFVTAWALAAPPPRITLHYDVSQNGMAVVEVTETLEHETGMES